MCGLVESVCACVGEGREVLDDGKLPYRAKGWVVFVPGGRCWMFPQY